ncbi:MAG: DNA polymerase/3'-5' exonuclease PolX [Bacteroidales bacterium]|nr:DNA polymerase/3'-5' exonuclease PolX [Bacteroidales bacterium]
MAVHNHEIAKALKKLSDLLEIDGASSFRVRAYRNGARTINEMSQELADLVEAGQDLSKLPDIGKNMADKIKNFVQTGKLPQLEEMQEKIPVDTEELLQISQLGAKGIKALYENLGITNMDQLKKAAEAGKVEALKGFGKKTQQKMLDEINKISRGETKGRFKWAIAEQIIEPYISYLRNIKGVESVDAAGSYRRKKETVGDMDLLVVADNPTEVMNRFVSYEEVKEVIAHGETKSSVILRTGLQVDLRVIPGKSYGAAMLYFTGSKAHNVAIRRIAQEQEYKINEYGIYRGETWKAGQTEEEMYNQIGLSYIEPELRENRGEVEAAQNNTLPNLVTMEDIKGDFQSHTKASDGKFTLEEMAEGARKKGYEYFSITDHSKRVTMAHGLDEKRLAQHIEAVDQLNEKIQNLKILKSIEVDILEDGTLDLSDDILKKLDIVVVAIHYNMNLSREKQTNRVLKAMESPYFHIMAHPTGRMIGKREGYELDMEKILDAAAEKGCFMEINAAPDRLDLSDIYARMAKDKGVKMALSTDAHNLDNLGYMRFGVNQARRAWLGPKDVINTYSWEELKKMIPG